jgi:valyl-tRNA synthetase
LHEALKTALRALAPVTPFITDGIYRNLYNKKGIHREGFPVPNNEWQSPLTKYTNLLLQTNAGFWKFKRDNNLSLRQGIPEACISGKLKPWAKDLQAMHGIGKLRFTKPKGSGFVEVSLPESSEVIHVRPPQSTTSGA